MSNPNVSGTQAVDRAAQLLTLVVEADGPMSYGELVDETGLAKSTTSRLLAALENNHLIERDPSGFFRSGALFALYAARHDPWAETIRLADPIMHRIGELTGETVNLAIARGDTVVQIAQVESTYRLAARDWMQVDAPAHCSAVGKVLYAWDTLPLPVGRLDAPTPHSLRSSDALLRQFGTIRRRGYATSREELEIGLDAVAVPVRGLEGPVVAGLGVSGPTGRLRKNLDEIGRLLIDQSAVLTRRLRPRNRDRQRSEAGVA
ncbi:IclR family transcriptional regulator [uncultured Jatrophihabitans sp.]|uniref:IclR family transcriptional regulator n=1 Tax=uncultured Jatrophihabitans sp. TaxID=1610747 RepID=UPI0035CB1F7A